MTNTLALAIVVSRSVLAQPPLAGQHAPQPVTDLIILPGGVFCGFDVQATAYGKAKTIRRMTASSRRHRDWI